MSDNQLKFTGPELVHRAGCRLCGSQNRDCILQLVPTPVGDHYLPLAALNQRQTCYPLNLTYCRDCHHLELPDAVNPQILYGNYIYHTSISLGLVEHFEAYAADAVARLQVSPQSLVIDIGSNDGTLLKAFKRHGLHVMGVDPASRAAARATADGIPTIVDFFSLELAEKIRREHPPVKVVTANNVFANIDDLPGMMRAVRELLADDGVFIFETGYMPDTIEGTVVDNVYHEHLCYFAVTPLARFFAAQGLELVDVSRVETKGGSLRGIVQRAGGPRKLSAAVADFIAAEKARGFHSARPHLAFAERVNRARDELQTLLEKLKADGKTIVGYGASVGVTTLLYHFGLGDKLTCLLDDNPIRHGLYSPGHQIPVVSSDVLYQQPIDYVLVLAWRYIDPIARKHQQFLDRGGKFILPLPTVKVV